MLSPTQAYQQQLNQANFVADPAQNQALQQLERLYQQLLARRQATQDRPSDSAATASLTETTTQLAKTDSPLTGLYLWGDVGRGKTFLMDLFFNTLPEGQKLRLHFHRFMARIHQELQSQTGHANPLRRIAQDIAEECDILCFDEFFVADIGDAMILGQLFNSLFEMGVTLVCTSNIPLERLYWGGVQRSQFEPTIALLQANTQQLHLAGQADHRLRHLPQQQTYFLAQEVDSQSLFDQLNQQQPVSQAPLTVCHRLIKVQSASADLVWFSFSDLCVGPRSSLDYIDIASRFATVLITNVPRLGGECRSWIKARGTEDANLDANETSERRLSYAPEDDAARRFISLIDEIYERRGNLYIVAQVALDQLYIGGALAFEFRRAFSRLSEMQSSDYLSRPHLDRVSD